MWKVEEAGEEMVGGKEERERWYERPQRGHLEREFAFDRTRVKRQRECVIKEKEKKAKHIFFSSRYQRITAVPATSKTLQSAG